MSEKNDRTVPDIKLSDLPVGTTIKDQEFGIFELSRHASGQRLWMEVRGHCMDCSDLVSEEGTDNPSKYQPGVTVATPAAEYFSNWEVLSVPVDINMDLLDQINKFNGAKIAHPYHRES